MRREGPNGIMRAIALESRKYRKSRCLEKACRTMNLMLEAPNQVAVTGFTTSRATLRWQV